MLTTKQALCALVGKQLVRAWGAPTTPPQKAWLKKLKLATAEHVYVQTYGEITQIEPANGRLRLFFLNEEGQVEVDWVVDCSGFDDRALRNPVYADLVRMYDLPLNASGCFIVNEHFEIEPMATPLGSIFVSGVGAAHNTYGPVDSFMGHHYSAIKSIERLAALPQATIKRLSPISSLFGWLKWAFYIAI